MNNWLKLSQIFACNIAMVLAIGDPAVAALDLITLLIGTALGIAKSRMERKLISNYIPKLAYNAQHRQTFPLLRKAA